MLHVIVAAFHQWLFTLFLFLLGRCLGYPDIRTRAKDCILLLAQFVIASLAHETIKILKMHISEWWILWKSHFGFERSLFISVSSSFIVCSRTHGREFWFCLCIYRFEMHMHAIFLLVLAWTKSFIKIMHYLDETCTPISSKWFRSKLGIVDRIFQRVQGEYQFYSPHTSLKCRKFIPNAFVWISLLILISCLARSTRPSGRIHVHLIVIFSSYTAWKLLGETILISSIHHRVELLSTMVRASQTVYQKM